MDIAELDINAVCFGILCNFPQFCGEERAKEAAELVRALYAERETLRADLARVTAERDAAVESIPHECKTCVHHTVFFNGCTPDHDCTNPDGGCSNNCDRWKWRGVKKED